MSENEKKNPSKKKEPNSLKEESSPELETVGFIFDEQRDREKDLSGNSDLADTFDAAQQVPDSDLQTLDTGEVAHSELSRNRELKKNEANVSKQKRTIGKYEIISVLGQGGMGKVYKALDPIIERYVAIKMLSQSQFNQADMGKERFFREAKAIGQLHHPNIITIHDAAEHEGVPYLVVEYLDGADLDELLEKNQLPKTDTLLSIMITICNVLEYAHSKGIIHRDLKPANIFYTRDGQVKLMDFGIAKLQDSKLTHAGMIIGTLYYMSPEQINAQPLDGRADIFSLGICMFELFSQYKPYEGETINHLIRNIVMEKPRQFDPVDTEIPALLADVIAKAMAREKENRYQSAGELALDLTKVKNLYNQKTKKIKTPVHSSLNYDGSTLETRTTSDDLTPILKISKPTEKLGPVADLPLPETDARDTPSAQDQTHGKRRFLLPLFIVMSAIIGYGLFLFYSPKNQGDILPNSTGQQQTPQQTTTSDRVDDNAPTPSQIQLKEDGGSTDENSLAKVWEDTLKLNTIADYESFITVHQNNPSASDFVIEAREKIASLKSQEEKARKDLKKKKDEILEKWDQTNSINSIPAFQTFVETYKNEPLAQSQLTEAHKKISLLREKLSSELMQKILKAPQMAEIKGNTFTMGDLFGDGDADEARHSVTVGDFAISLYEVTFAEYDHYCEKNGVVKPDDVGFGRKLHPVINVSWFDAVRFCNWLSNQNGLTPCYSINDTNVSCNFQATGYRLPTEAEWEFAAREAGKNVKFGHGRQNVDKNQLNYNNNKPGSSNSGTVIIGSTTPNNLGLYDMSGNTWEWCWDFYREYSPESGNNPAGPPEGSEKVIRGGSWKNISTAFLRTTNRSASPPDIKGDDIGFRLVRTP